MLHPELRAGLSRALVSRLELVLPSRTGLSLAEVELNLQFILTTNLILKHCKLGAASRGHNFVLELISALVDLLSALNIDPQTGKLLDRDEKTFLSTLIVTKVLKTAIYTNWSPDDVEEDDSGDLFVHSDIDFNTVPDTSVDSLEVYSFPVPAKLDIPIHSVLEVLLTVLSNEVNNRALLALRRTSPELLLRLEDTFPGLALSADKIREHYLEIDFNISVVLKYLAACNSYEYYLFLHEKLFLRPERGEHIPSGYLQKYSHLLMHVYFTPEVTEPFLRNIYSSIPFIRSTTWTHLFLYYGSWCLQYQFIYRPDFYATAIYPGSVVDQSCKSLFDFLSTILEDESTLSLSLFSWYVLTCPSDFNEILHKPNKLKMTFNKRVRFLNSLLRETQSGNSLDKFECMANIFLQGSVMPEGAGGVREFSERYLDEVYEHLKSLRNHFHSTSQGSRYGLIYLRITTSALSINPEKHIPLFLKTFVDVRMQIRSGDRDARLMGDFYNLFAAIKSLSKESFYKSTFQAVMKEITPSLLAILNNVCYILQYYDKTYRTASSRPRKGSDDFLRSSTNSLLASLEATPLSGTTANHSQAMPFYCATDRDVHNEVNTTVVYVDRDFTAQPMKDVETILAELLNSFAAAPQCFFKCPNKDVDWESEASIRRMTELVSKVIAPIKLAIRFKTFKNSNECFEAACNLARKLLRAPGGSKFCVERQCLSFLISIEIVAAVSESLLTFPAEKFQQCFLIFNRFLHDRYRTFWRVKDCSALGSVWAHTKCQRACNAYEVILLYALCTHDVQFFNLAKASMRYYVLDLTMPYHHSMCKSSTLVKPLEQILNDKSVFTGFVSLHKKFRAILIDADPTESLCQVWLLINERWIHIAEDEQRMVEENNVFRHYTGFLMCTSGCFADPEFAKLDPMKSELVMRKILDFYDNVVNLLLLSELVVRVVIKDSLSSETHSALFQMVCEKLSSVILDFVLRGVCTDEAVTFVEEALLIFSIMVGGKSDGSYALAGMLPRVGNAAIQFLSLLKNPVDQIKLKLRICKLGCVIESEYERLGFRSSHKLRNYFAKRMSGWLEEAVFYNEESHSPTSQTLPSAISTDQLSIAAESSSTGGRNTDVDYLQMELAFEASKCLSLQLHSLVLDIPDGTKESNVEHARNLAFSHYFSLFYKILQKYTINDSSPAVQRSRYKIQGIVENVLSAFSNILKSDSNIGMPFALPLGYHENKKIRAIFLEIFATMLSARQQKMAEEEFPEPQIVALSEVYEIYSSAAEIASPSEHNLLATSLHGLFAYTKNLDKLFDTLLKDEVEKVSRASDIFRGNSCLTRLMSIMAKDYGTPYLTVVLRPFIEDMIDNEVSFEVEKNGTDKDVEIFLTLLNRLVDSIVNLTPWVPEAFKFICARIYQCIEKKFGDAVLIAVGSFIFLRFFCPVIVSPESSFDMQVISPKVKRSLIQIVKVIQYMANGSLSNLKWAKLADKMDIMEELNQKIFKFLEGIALESTGEAYPFLSLTRKPYSSLRYLHKFFYTYLPEIRVQYVSTPKIVSPKVLHHKIANWTKLDSTLQVFGAPKFSISLQGSKSFKVADSLANIGTSQFSEFMAKMSAKNIEMSLDTPVVHTSVFHDGTPIVVANFRHIREIGYDINTFVYMLFEAASQIWDSKFYCVLDFTQFFFVGILGKNYTSLMASYAPKQFFNNCARTYYYNLPRNAYLKVVENMIEMRKQGNEKNRVYFYTQQDDPEIINSLCLEESVTSINQDVRSVYKNCKFYDEFNGTLSPVTMKFGHKWLQLCYEREPYEAETVATKTVAPVETHMITDLTKCEISNKSGAGNEFTISLNRYNYQVTLVSPQRQEILRSLYFAMLRNSKDQKLSASAADDSEREIANRFNVLVILVFHGLLERDDEVRASAAKLFSVLDSYFELDLGMSPMQTDKVTFPIDTTDFVVGVSTHLSKKRPEYTYEFIKAFFTNFTKLPTDLRLSGILYISPWLDNVGRYVVRDHDGTEKMASIIRLFCRMTILNKSFAPVLNEKIWKKLFNETGLIHILVEEIVSFAIDNISDPEICCTIIAMMSPSVELCGEVVARINKCIAESNRNDSELAIQSKQLEITVLVKVCGSLFFNSYLYGSLYLPDVFLFCTLFIDNPGLEFGSDLQKLVINTLRAFSQNQDLSENQLELINTSVKYFSSQRAKMLFGLTSRERVAHSDPVQNFNRAMSFELLCDNLHDFICEMGSADEKSRWLARWSSLSMDIAFGNSLFQRRALMVVCTLARKGISDSTGGKILKLVSSMLLNTPDFEFDCALCYCSLEQGFTRDSVYLPLMIWSMFCSVFIVQPSTYQATIQCVGNIMKHVNRGFLDMVVSHRADLEPLLSKFEERIGIKLDLNNFEPAILFLISKGLTSTQFRHNSLQCLFTILLHRFRLVDSDDESVEFDGDISTQKTGQASGDVDEFRYFYLLLSFLSNSEEKFKDQLIGLSLDHLPETRMSHGEIPSILIEKICSGTLQARFVLILVAFIFRSDSDQTFKCRFVELYYHIFNHLRSTAYMIFHLIQEELEHNIVENPSNEIVGDISKLLVHMMDDTQYSEEECIATVSDCLKQLNFSIIDRVGKYFSANEPVKDALASLKLMHNMIYRTFCNAFEGLRLEKF